MTLSKDAIIQYFKALDMEGEKIFAAIPRHDIAIFQATYFAVAPARNKLDHEEDIVFSHYWQRRFYGMQACYFCHVRLNGETRAFGDLK